MIIGIFNTLLESSEQVRVRELALNLLLLVRSHICIVLSMVYMWRLDKRLGRLSRFYRISRIKTGKLSKNTFTRLLKIQGYRSNSDGVSSTDGSDISGGVVLNRKIFKIVFYRPLAYVQGRDDVLQRDVRPILHCYFGLFLPLKKQHGLIQRCSLCHNCLVQYSLS